MSKRRLKLVYHVAGDMPINETKNCRVVELDDLDKIAWTMLDAYRDTVDYEGETYDETLAELKNVVNDGYGKYLAEASFLIEHNDEIASAILINLYKGKPLITYVFTAKKFLNHGHATSLINRSIKALKDMGYNELTLYVTEENINALRLYKKLGFIDAGS